MADTSWFQNAKFGLFVHFGLYSIPAGIWKGQPIGRNHYAEWIRYQWGWPAPGGIPRADYDRLLSQFNPRQFDADFICSEAAAAGMKYFVFTTKHHDGFALWPTDTGRYGLSQSACRRDLLGEMVAAGRRHGLKIGFYYSHWQDWEYPGGGLPPWPEMPGDPVIRQPADHEFEAYWTEKCLPQVGELIDRYSPDLFWFDSWGEHRHKQLTGERLRRLIALIRHKKAEILINSRIGTEEGVDYRSADDNAFPSRREHVVSETSATMNRSWGYSLLDRDFRSTREILRSLVNSIARGSNVQLNIGPKGDGSLEPGVVRRLRDLASWMSVNSRGFHDTRPVDLPEPAWGRMVRKGSSLFAYVFDWDLRNGLALPSSCPHVESGVVLETEAAVGIENDAAGGQRILLPHSEPDDRLSFIELKCCD